MRSGVRISDTTAAAAAAAHYAGPPGTGGACPSLETESNVLGNYTANSDNEHQCVLCDSREIKSFSVGRDVLKNVTVARALIIFLCRSHECIQQ